MQINRVPVAVIGASRLCLVSLLIVLVMLACVPARAEGPPSGEAASPAPGAELPKPETVETPKAETPKAETPKVDTAEPGTEETTPAAPAKGKNGGKRTIDLMKNVESPVTTIASSVQWNAYFDMNKKTPGSLAMLASIPQDIGGWHIIHRASVGMPYVPLSLLTPPGGPAPPGPEFGIGDTTYTPLFSPHIPGRFIWAFGPSLTIPTATGRVLGTGKFLTGPSLVGVFMTRHMTIGVLASQQWSVAGDPHRNDVSAATIQPVFFYNFPSRWYIVSTPRLYVNWNARQSPKWSIPVGGGIGKFFRIGKQLANVSLQGFYHLERPAGALWSMNLQFQLLWPTVKPAKE